MANLFIYDQFMWREMENYYGFFRTILSQNKSFGVKERQRKLSESDDALSRKSLRKITENYLKLTIDPTYISCTAVLVWLHSGFAAFLCLASLQICKFLRPIKISWRRQFICYCAAALIADAVSRINDYFSCLTLKSSLETFTTTYHFNLFPLFLFTWQET